MTKTRANANAVAYTTRQPDNGAMSFDWAVSSGLTRYDNEPTRLEAGFNDLYSLFGYLEASHGWHSRNRNVWYAGRYLMPVDVLLNEFEGVTDFEHWLDYAMPSYKTR